MTRAATKPFRRPALLPAVLLGVLVPVAGALVWLGSREVTAQRALAESRALDAADVEVRAALGALADELRGKVEAFQDALEMQARREAMEDPGWEETETTSRRVFVAMLRRGGAPALVVDGRGEPILPARRPRDGPAGPPLPELLAQIRIGRELESLFGDPEGALAHFEALRDAARGPAERVAVLLELAATQASLGQWRAVEASLRELDALDGAGTGAALSPRGREAAARSREIGVGAGPASGEREPARPLLGLRRHAGAVLLRAEARVHSRDVRGARALVAELLATLAVAGPGEGAEPLAAFVAARAAEVLAAATEGRVGGGADAGQGREEAVSELAKALRRVDAAWWSEAGAALERAGPGGVVVVALAGREGGDGGPDRRAGGGTSEHAERQRAPTARVSTLGAPPRLVGIRAIRLGPAAGARGAPGAGGAPGEDTAGPGASAPSAVRPSEGPGATGTMGVLVIDAGLDRLVEGALEGWEARGVQIRVRGPDGRIVAGDLPGMARDEDGPDEASDVGVRERRIPLGGALRGASAEVRLTLAPDVAAAISREARTLLFALLATGAALVLAAAFIARAMLREIALERARADFVAGVTHDLKTPLSLVRMYAETLKLGRATAHEEVAGFLDVILRESDRLHGLVENLLAHQRRGEPLTLAAIDLGATLRDIIAGLPPAGSGEARVELLVREGVPPVRHDPAAVERIVRNLVANALRFAPGGSRVVVSLEGEGGSEPPAAVEGGGRRGGRGQGDVVLRVTDEGPGVAPEVAERLFEPFATTARSGGGTGLGLAVVRALAEAQGGRAGYRRGTGGGAIFEVRLPA